MKPEVINDSGLKKDLQRIIVDHLDRGEIIEVESVCAEILASHDDIYGDDSEFYVFCANGYIKTAVKRVLKSDTGIGELVGSGRQMMLEGFEHLQPAYTMVRDGKAVIVPLDQITDEEIDERINVYRRTQKGSGLHADELVLYKAWRVEHRAVAAASVHQSMRAVDEIYPRGPGDGVGAAA